MKKPYTCNGCDSACNYKKKDEKGRDALGLTLLGATGGAGLVRQGNKLSGRIYIPDPDLPLYTHDVSCDVEITFDPAQLDTASANIGFSWSPACTAIKAAKSPVTLKRQDAALQPPTAENPRCDYQD
jgi:hypothetical protein